MTYSALQDHIYDWAAAQLSGVTIIWNDQNGPRPTPPFIALQILAMPKIGQADSTMADDTGQITRSWGEDVPMSIQGFGGATYEHLATLRSSLDRQAPLQALSANGIAVKDGDGPISDISETVDTDRERRWLFEPTFGIQQTLVDDVGYIETFEYTGGYE